MKTEYRPIAMRCTQEQFDSIKDRIPLPIKYISSFDSHDYLINNYKGENLISNVIYPINLGLIANETFNGELFLDCCGREKEDSFARYVSQNPRDYSIKEYLKNKVLRTSELQYKSDSDKDSDITQEQKDAIIKEYLKNKVWKGNEMQYTCPDYISWLSCSNSQEYRLKPQLDYSKEIEALENKAKENGRKVIIKIE